MQYSTVQYCTVGGGIDFIHAVRFVLTILHLPHNTTQQHDTTAAELADNIPWRLFTLLASSTVVVVVQ